MQFSNRACGRILIAGFLAVAACAKNNNSGSTSPAVQTDALKVASKSWCTIDNMTDSFQIVTRLTFTADKAQFDYLRISDGAGPVLYKINEVSWAIADKNSSYAPYDSFSVEIVDDVDRVASQGALSQQKQIAEKLISKNSHLIKVPQVFSPKQAVVVKNSNLLSAKDTERTMYPCSDYSSSFLIQSPVNPTVEFDLYFAQVLWNDDFEKTLPKNMNIAFPVTEVKLDSAPEGSQWCSWFDMGTRDYKKPSELMLFLNTITIGQNKYVTNSHSDISMDSDAGTIESLKKHANESRAFDMTIKDGRISGSRVESSLGNFVFSELYSLVQDANGVKALVKRNAYHPENSALPMLFSDVYFDCGDPRPLQFSPRFKKFLKPTLEFQLEQLKK
jgi:hypothetical protein